jgi:hypothetical protein
LNTLSMGVNVGGPQQSTRARKSQSAKKQRPAKKTRKGGQPGQGASVMMNNFFPALNGQQRYPQGSAAQQAAEQQALQEHLLQQQQEEDPMQLINEVPLEEEEGESQDVT